MQDIIPAYVYTMGVCIANEKEQSIQVSLKED